MDEKTVMIIKKILMKLENRERESEDTITNKKCG
ncbi:hypothetical protein EV214_103173 [Marinisporobacter balticus]|uniref:Uncharacterized protein n=1 Tax=Marinisporobacter balticus TaxID=2018667 RepID=A0A4R2KX28_9FIRM|nr:hypothetical protein EV214_103173 [Marinisporobacter balticus]